MNYIDKCSNLLIYFNYTYINLYYTFLTLDLHFEIC